MKGVKKRPKSNLEIKKTMSEMKNTQNWINSRLHIAVENVIELEDSNRSYPNETERKKH